jgi:hypothetical protein
MDDAFRGICGELLAIAQSMTVIPIFEAVLIDEAQGLPPEFFKHADRPQGHLQWCRQQPTDRHISTALGQR